MSVPTTASSGTADRALQTNRLDEIAVQLARQQATARPDRSAAPEPKAQQLPSASLGRMDLVPLRYCESGQEVLCRFGSQRKLHVVEVHRSCFQSGSDLL
jgi:hypothetical protein